MLIIILVMIKHDQLLNLNSWYKPIYTSKLTSEFIASYFINVMSWALRYESVCLIMIWTYGMPVKMLILTGYC